MKLQTRSASYIPEELLFNEVLTRLPAKSLGRFRCVSRSWYAQIYSPEFIKMHYYNRTRKRSDSDQQLIFTANTGIETSNLYSIELDKVRHMNTKKLINFSNRYGTIMGSCNGLLCLRYHVTDSETQFIIFNPLIRKQWRLPVPPGPPNPEQDYYSINGYGYDEISDDYKIFRSFANPKMNESVVYSMKSNSWRKFPIDQTLDHITLLSPLGIFACNSLHWTTLDDGESDIMIESDDYNSIAAFDLSTEKFSLLPPPKLESRDNPIDDINLGSLDGCLSAIFYGEKMASVWLMKEYGIANSWTKLTVLRFPYLGKVTPLAWLSHGSYRQLLLYRHPGSAIIRNLVEDYEITLYNHPGSLIIHNIEEDSTPEIIDFGKELSCFEPCICPDSLFQPRGGSDK